RSNGAGISPRSRRTRAESVAEMSMTCRSIAQGLAQRLTTPRALKQYGARFSFRNAIDQCDSHGRRALMDDVFPVLSGIAVGLGLGLIPAALGRVALAVASVVFGVLASWFSGELAFSWIYVVIDMAQVLGATLLTSLLVARWRHRAWRLS